MGGGIPRGDENAAGSSSKWGRPNGGEGRVLDQILSGCGGYGLGPVARIEPAQQILDIGLDGVLAEVEAAGDHGVRVALGRSEERRVGKECRSRWSPYH